MSGPLNEDKIGCGHLWAINWLPPLTPWHLLSHDHCMIIMWLFGPIRAQLTFCSYPHVSMSSSSTLITATRRCWCLQIWLREFMILKTKPIGAQLMIPPLRIYDISQNSTVNQYINSRMMNIPWASCLALLRSNSGPSGRLACRQPISSRLKAPEVSPAMSVSASFWYTEQTQNRNILAALICHTLITQEEHLSRIFFPHIIQIQGECIAPEWTERRGKKSNILPMSFSHMVKHNKNTLIHFDILTKRNYSTWPTRDKKKDAPSGIYTLCFRHT